MKTLYWEHQYLVGMTDKIEIPDDFVIKESWTKWGTLTLISTDGEELEFESSLNYDNEFKRPEQTIIYDKEFNEIHRTKE